MILLHSLSALPLLLAPTAVAPGGDGAGHGSDEPAAFDYEIDLTDHSDDLFHVTLRPSGLTSEDRFFDFVGFAPGAHSPLNFGRFVETLQAFDASGAELDVERVDTNRWELSAPTDVARIDYAIEDTYDSQDKGGGVMPACGSGIEADYALLNPFAILGYFERHLTTPVRLALRHDPEWLVGTALTKKKDGFYHAASYRELADSPILMGELSTTGIFVGDIEVEIFVRSTNVELNAEEILFAAGDALVAAEKFIGFAPVNRYVFLMDFLNVEAIRRNRFRGMGALEHSYSSLYTLPDFGGTEQIAGVIAHEFMHILTPLHLKSTVIANFDYSIPTTDQHLWLYEGITEWSANMLRLRGGLTDIEEHLRVLSGKIRFAKSFEPAYSLTRLSAEWSTPEGGRQYVNIYQQGALVGTALNIRLLQLSGGKRGLREVFFEFVEKYGKGRPFDPDTFFDELVAATYPEIGTFIDDHIRGNVPLPFEELFAAIGVEYGNGSLRLATDPSPEALALREVWASQL